MKVDGHMDPKRLISLLSLGAILVLALALAGCGGGGSSSSSGSESSSSASESEAPAGSEEAAGEEEEGGEEEAEAGAEEEEEGEGGNAAGYKYAGSAAETAEAKAAGEKDARAKTSPPSDKSIGVIQLSGESATSIQVAEAAEKIGDMFGYSVNVCDPELQEAKFAECGTSIMAQNPSMIISVSTNAAAFGSAVKDAEAKGIPWFNVGSAVTESSEVNNYGVDGFALAKVLDDYMFEAMREKSSAGKLKVFAITAPTVGVSSLNSETELKKNAEEAGDVELEIHNLDLANAPQDTLNSSRQTLERNPELAGMWTLCDFCLPLMAQSVSSYGGGNEVVVAGEFSNPQSIADIRKGTVDAVSDNAWALPVWVAVDQVLANWTAKEEIVVGEKVFGTYSLPFMEPYLLTKENVGAGGPAPIFGPDYESYFKAKWAKEYGVG
jgi:ABC-type sugar transport system substrate-binding protein